VQQEAIHHPYASVLRQRSARLRDLARSIERSVVMTLEQVDANPSSCSTRARLCETMLARNLHQLHEAVEQLRDTAHRMQMRAAELELATMIRGAA
jgi:hypothetical protein